MPTTDSHISRPKARRRLVGTMVVLLLVAGAGLAIWYVWGRPSVRAERLLSKARGLHMAGETKQAEQTAAAALKLDNRRGEAALLAAECAVANGDPRRAVDYLRGSRSGDPQVRMRTALFAAELYYKRLYRFAEAEKRYRAVLKIDPEHVEANTGLARLLGLCGRRDDAIPHVLRLVRQGHPTDLLFLLGRESGVINDLDALQRARQAALDDPNPLVGLAWHAANDSEHDRAIDLLREALRLQPDHVAAYAALGQRLSEARRFEELARWAEGAFPAADQSAAVWLVRARMAEHTGDLRAAVRSYWEAARRAPESKTANFRLARLFMEIGKPELSAQFTERVGRLQELEDVQNRFVYSVDYFWELSQSFEQAGRLWEAYGWCQAVVQSGPPRPDAQLYLRELRSRTQGLPLRLTTDAANPALAVDFSSWPVSRSPELSAAPSMGNPTALTPLSFRNDASSTGLQFRYFNGSDEPTRRMFEFTGGGAGVLDFDLDGFADVCFTQGRRWPPEEPDVEHHDCLFRNRMGSRFEHVTRSAGILEEGFGQGVSAGDVDADGFADLYIANIGPNRLWRNNGDGTFTDITREAGLSGREWTTSCVVADLDGDGLPDIYDVNYVTGEDVYERVCPHDDGLPALCMPFHFDGQPDRLWLNDGHGGFADATAGALSVVPDGKGLGAAVWDAHGNGRLSLLVANDATPNFFFVRESDESGDFILQERGIASGLALNEEGKATGCMGVALGDLNDDGLPEVHITNFLAEANTFWMGAEDGFFEDRTRAAGLHAPSFEMLGFGTQFLDADLDGRLELFVSNGHVDDLRRIGKPYAMRAQLFRWDGRRFFEADPVELGPYFQREWLGRPVARLDWNRDGREDLLVGHLEADSALLTNTTSQPGRFLSLRLFGVRSSRDAIGTTVEARVGESRRVRQLTAGDGYQASNERRIIIGTGDADLIDELVVRWPSGAVQRFEGLRTGELWLREGGSPLGAPAVQEPGR